MHVSIYVSDIQKSTEFYSQFFGVAPVKVKADYAKFVLESPSLIISFVQNPARVQANFGHLGFQVASVEDLDRRLVQARQLGLVSREEVGTHCCYAKQDKFWVNDPDGVQWEVYYFHADAEFNDPHYEGDPNAVCCLPNSVETVMTAQPKEVLSACC